MTGCGNDAGQRYVALEPDHVAIWQDRTGWVVQLTFENRIRRHLYGSFNEALEAIPALIADEVIHPINRGTQL